MPVRAARSSIRGLPPLGLGGPWGNSGSITSHRSSVTSSLPYLDPTRYRVLLGVVSAPTPPADAAATLPEGFQDEAVFTGLTSPTNVEFSKDKQSFVAAKSGLMQVFDDLSDTTSATIADLRTDVHPF